MDAPDELQHLQKFESIVSITIPSHPHYLEKKGEKTVVELQVYLVDVRKRMQELLGDCGAHKHGGDKFNARTLKTRSPKTLSERTKPYTKSKGTPRRAIESPGNQKWESWVHKLHEAYSFVGSSSLRKKTPSPKKKALSKTRDFRVLSTSSTTDSNNSSSPVRKLDIAFGPCPGVAKDVQAQDEGKFSFSIVRTKNDDAHKDRLSSTLSSVQRIKELSRKLVEWNMKYEQEQLRDQLMRKNQEISAGNPNLGGRISECTKTEESAQCSDRLRMPISAEFVSDQSLGKLTELQIAHSGRGTSSWNAFESCSALPAAVKKKIGRAWDGSAGNSQRSLSSPGTSANQKSAVQWTVEDIQTMSGEQSSSLVKDHGSKNDSAISIGCHDRKRSTANMQHSCKESQVDMSHQSSSPSLVVDERITMVESSMKDLKESLENFRLQIEKEGQHWRDKVDMLEKKFERSGDTTKRELLDLKTGVQDAIQWRSNEALKELARAQKILNENETKQDIDERIKLCLKECTTQIDFLKEQVDGTLLETKAAISKEIEEKLAITSRSMKQNIRHNVDDLELGVSKDIETMRLEIARHESLFINSDAVRRGERERLEVLIQETVDKSLSEKMETSTEGKTRAMSEMRHEICLLAEKMEALVEGRGLMQENLNQLTQLVEKSTESAGEEQDNLKSENQHLKKQLQYLKKEGMTAWIEAEDYKRHCKAEIEKIKLNIIRLQDNEMQVKTEIESVRRLEDSLKLERVNLRNLVESITREEERRAEEFQNLKRVTAEFEKDKERFKHEGAQESMLIIGKVEGLSQLYLGGLEEVRNDALRMKIELLGRLDEVESRLKEYQRKEGSSLTSSPPTAVLDALESRMTALENKQEALWTIELDRTKIEKTRLSIEKERDSAFDAAREASEAASRAEEILESLTSELLNARRVGIKLQESLTSERDAILGATAEVRSSSVKLCQERDLALTAAADVKNKFEEVQKVLDSSMLKARDDLAAINNQRIAASDTASEMSSISLKAEKVFAEMTMKQGKVTELEGHLTGVVGRALRETREMVESGMLKAKHDLTAIHNERITAADASSEMSAILLKAEELLAEMATKQDKITELESDLTGVVGRALKKAHDMVDSSMLKACDDLTAIHNQRITAADAASEMSAILLKAKEFLVEMATKQDKITELESDLTGVVGTTVKEAHDMVESSLLKARDDITAIHNEQITAADAASEMSAMLLKAEEFLAEMATKQDKITELESDLTGIVGRALKEAHDMVESSMPKARDDLTAIHNERITAADAASGMSAMLLKAEEFLAEMATKEGKITELESDLTGIVGRALKEAHDMVESSMSKARNDLTAIHNERITAADAASEVSAILLKAEELLAEMTTKQGKVTELEGHLTEVVGRALAENHEMVESSMLKAQEDLTVINNERIATAAAASEMASILLKAEESLAEITIKQVKCTELEGDLTEAIGRALKETHDSCNKEFKMSICDWERAMEAEIFKAKTIANELDKLKERALVCVSKTVGEDSQGLKLAHIQKEQERLGKTIGNEIQELAEGAKHLIVPEVLQQAQVEFRKQFEEEKNTNTRDIKFLSDQMGQVLERLSVMPQPVREEEEGKLFHSQSESDYTAGYKEIADELRDLDQKLKASTAEQFRISKKISKFGKRMQKLERVQVNLNHSFDEVRTSTSSLERSASVWLPKYEVAVMLLKEVESRLGLLESSFSQRASFLQSDGKVDKEGTVTKESQGNLQEDLQALADDELKERAIKSSMDGKFVALENRLEHVATATYTNLRILDAKVEHIRVGVQSALEGAAVAENKCGALGEELVKFFRMLASSGKDFPRNFREGSKHLSSANMSPNRKHLRMEPFAGVKSKIPVAHAACRYCKEAAAKTSGEGETSSKLYKHFDQGQKSVRKISVRLGHFDGVVSAKHSGHVEEVPNRDTTLKLQKTIEECGNPDHKAAVSKDRVAQALSMFKCSYETSGHGQADASIDGGLYSEAHRSIPETIRGTNSGSGLESRDSVPERSMHRTRPDIEKKVHLDLGKNSQRTNIRLESGKIHVNVSHRSAVIAGAHSIRKKDSGYRSRER